MRLLVCGTRIPTGAMASLVNQKLSALRPLPSLIIEGGAFGVDRFACYWALSRGVPHIRFDANWERDGRAAGPIRNLRMLEEGQPDLVAAFHTERSLGRGTADMVRQARAAGVRVEIHLLGAT